MEEYLRPKAPPAFPDLAATEGCMHESTRSNPSSLPVEKSERNHDANAEPGKCTAWTDEKHKLYLDRLEASFVNQLHHSTGLLTWHSKQKVRDPNSSGKLPANTANASEQFTVLQEGCWQKINFKRNQPLLDTAANSRVVRESPWTCHFRHGGNCCTKTLRENGMLPSGWGMQPRAKRTFSLGLATGSEHSPVNHQCHQDSGGSIKEVSDQNFEEEDRKEKSSCLSMAKRFKTAVAESSSQDQIVPLGKFSEISTLCYSSLQREEVRQEWPSENLESFLFPEHEVKSFLRES